MDKSLKPMSALGHDTAQTLQIGGIVIAERLDVSLASLAVRWGRDADVALAAQAAGVPLPAAARAEQRDPFAAFWVTPEMWFIEAPIDRHEDIAADLKAVFGEAASVTEQTGAWVRFDLTAPDLTLLLERLTNLNLAGSPNLYASRTVIDHLGCYLIKRSANQVTLYGPRSSAASLLHALEVAAKSVV